MSLQSVRGTHDLLPDQCARHLQIVEVARHMAELYGFREMATPIFEFSDVFSRTLGDTSDIVTKEMYSFQDKGGDWLTLRPEGTASIARSFISEGLSQNTPLKVFYQGPMFRYERPQKGRQRQFHQFGVELLGVASPLADVECLTLADDILSRLAIRPLTRLEINSIGDRESRKAYVGQLVDYLSRFERQLSEDSQRRLKQNPLRILDSKSEQDQTILTGAPDLKESLSPAAQNYFEQFQQALSDLGIEYHLNSRLVRGLDYYSHVVFEYRTQALGAQDAVISGGRYDDLIEQMGGPATAGVGWAAGIERLELLWPEKVASTRPIALVALGPEGERESVKLAHELRAQGFYTEITFSGNLSKRMKKAAGLNARWVLIVGGDELKANQVSIKDLDKGEQQLVARPHIVDHLKKS